MPGACSFLAEYLEELGLSDRAEVELTEAWHPRQAGQGLDAPPQR
jgi:hypothetical protein